MKSTAKIAVLSGLLYLTASIAFSYGSNPPDMDHNGIAGSYLIDRPDMYSVYYATVFEDSGQLYIAPELVTDTARLEAVDGEAQSFHAEIKGMGKYELTFSQTKEDQYQRLSMERADGKMRMEGVRSNADLLSLRDYHKRSGGEFVYHPPLQLSDGLSAGTLGETDFDSTVLHTLFADLTANNNYMHSILLIDHGKLVVEEYFNGWDPVRIHRLQSVTKSITSTMVGLALEEGIIGSVQDPAYKYLSHYDSLLTGNKRNITVEHLLTMSAGFDWNEAATYYAAPEKCDAHLAGASGDFIRYVLNKPLATVPGERFYYNSGYPNILGHMICEVTGLNILEFALPRFFEPLGIERAFWMPNFSEEYYRPGCAGGLFLTSRAMAKIGLLYLRDGEWNGKQVLDPAWVRASIEGKMDAGNGTRYGYQWKSTRSRDGKYEIFFASGTGGQYIACLPELDVVVVTTARFNTDKGDKIAMMLLARLLPALYKS